MFTQCLHFQKLGDNLINCYFIFLSIASHCSFSLFFRNGKYSEQRILKYLNLFSHTTETYVATLILP